MITLTLGNSECQVRGVTREVFRKLRNVISISEKSGQVEKKFIKLKSGKTKVEFVPIYRRRYLMDKAGRFPTGLLYLAEQFLRQGGHKYVINDTRIVPALNQAEVDTLYVHRPYTPYPEQTEAALAALAYERGIIVGPTGVGKSAIAAEICDAFRVPTLIVVPSLALKKQLTAGLREVFGTAVVGPLANGRVAHFITVENVDALDPRRKLEGIDLVIIDEFHHSGAKTYRVLNKRAWSGVYFKIGLTATPFRSKDDERLLLESVLSHVIYRIPYAVAVSKGYIVPLESYYFELPAVKLKRGSSNWHSVYRQLVVERADRNELIAETAGNLIREKKSTLILTKQIPHGEALRDLLGIPFAEGKNDLNPEILRAFNCLEHTGVVGTDGVMGEGVDTKAAEYVFLAGGGKSKNRFMQNAGRGFRNFVYPWGKKESCKLIMFYDPSHAWLDEHFSACVKHLRDEYGQVPTKLSL